MGITQIASAVWDSLGRNRVSDVAIRQPIREIYENQPFWDETPYTRDWLVETPIPGVYHSPYEAVDPTNCEQWPNSPYCAGLGGFDVYERAKPIDLDIRPRANPCEVCVEMEGSIFGMRMAPYYLCQRMPWPECQPLPPESPFPESKKAPELENIHLQPNSPINHMRFVGAYSIIRKSVTPGNDGRYSITILNENNIVEGEDTLLDAYYEYWKQNYERTFTIEKGVVLSTNGTFMTPNLPVPIHWTDPTLNKSVGNYLFKQHPYYYQKTEKKFANIIGNQQTLSVPDKDELNVWTSTTYDITSMIFWVDIPCNDFDISGQFNQVISNMNAFFTGNWHKQNASLTNTFSASELENIIGGYALSFDCQLIDIPTIQPIPGDENMDCCEDILELLESVHSKLSVPINLNQDFINYDNTTRKFSSEGESIEGLGMALGLIGSMLRKIHDTTKYGEKPYELTKDFTYIDENEEEQTIDFEVNGIGIDAIYKALEMNYDANEEIWNKVKDGLNAIASLPDVYAVKTNRYKPQLQVFYKTKDDSRRSSRWHFTIPHFDPSKKNRLDPPSYVKGSIMCVLELNDNSQIVINAKTKKEGKKIIRYFLPLIDRQQTRDINIEQIKYHEIPNRNLLEIEVKPDIAKFFEEGTNELPLWDKRFK